MIISQYIFLFHCWWTFELFLAIMNSGAIAILVHVFDWTCSYICSAKSFLKWLYQFILLPAMFESCSCSKSSPPLVAVSLFFILAILLMLLWSFVVLSCIFLMSWMDFSKAFSYVNIPFCEVSVQVFCPFFDWEVCLFVLDLKFFVHSECVNSWDYVLWRSPTRWACFSY